MNIVLYEHIQRQRLVEAEMRERLALTSLIQCVLNKTQPTTCAFQPIDAWVNHSMTETLAVFKARL
jgi:hypothetical protein